MSQEKKEKQEISLEEIERQNSSTSSPVIDTNSADGELLQPDVRPLAERKLVRRLDSRLLPTIILIYLLNYIDRVAVTAARLKGLEADLHLTSIQYATILAILYVTYTPAQLPSNMILNWVSRPRMYISTCVVLWGVVSACIGTTNNFAQLCICRVLLGLPEAAFYPGAMYLLSRWYTKKELAFRGAIIYVGLLISNAFGSLMAAGILSGMEGKLGIRAWRWLFYIEGCLTICVGLLSLYLLPDYPHNTLWLSPAERRLGQVRLAEDAGEADEDVSEESPFLGLKLAITDMKVWIFAVMGASQLLGLSFINFFPTLTATLGFGTTASLLLAAPPWVLASIVCCANAWHADKTGERFFHIATWWWVVIVGYLIGISSLAVSARYVSMFLMTLGYSGFALTLVWVSNVITRPPAKRSAAMGIVNGFGNIGNLVGSFVWDPKWQPAYRPSMIIAISGLVLATVMGLLMRWLLVRANKQLDRDELGEMAGANRTRLEEAARLEGISFEEAIKKKKGFRYLY